MSVRVWCESAAPRGTRGTLGPPALSVSRDSATLSRRSDRPEINARRGAQVRREFAIILRTLYNNKRRATREFPALVLGK